MTDRHAEAPQSAPTPRVEAPAVRERRRQEALAEYGLLDPHAVSRPELRSLVALAAQACGVSMATLNLITEDHQHQVESVGFEGTVSQRSDSMCAVVVDDAEPVVLADAREDERFRDNPWVTADHGVRFYATFQLRTPAAVPIGSLCVFDPLPQQIDDEQRARLVLLAERVVDVLELELRSRRLHTLNAELVEANARLARFAQTVSHDLRTPLTSVGLTLDLAAEELAAGHHDEVAPLLARARRSASRMASTVEMLLDQARDAVTALIPVRVDEVLADVLDDLRGELVAVDLAVAAPLPAVVGHADALRVVLQNLLLNAAQHAAPHDPRVRVEADSDAGWCRLAVVDHGPGVPEAEQQRVFGLGHQVRTVLSGTGVGVGGHGIGLASSRHLVEAMGGTLTLHDTPGGGARFVVSLPTPAPIVILDSPVEAPVTAVVDQTSR
ncbi:GAF domain-containing sensor histidine kinase [Nocardioides nanhaiensis]|uniref:Sensor-like histidine kinase SenX3 n=1 Tax=Nocardioides nanhaiensis TaxID=1476871 RepID=A0ABP8VVH7_9ACTN